LPGGFKTRGLRIKGDDTPIAPGEFRDVDVPSGAMRDNLMPLPYKEPSQVLYSLLGTIVDEGRKFAGSSELSVSDMSANAPVGTTLAILERTLKTMSAIQSRIHYSMKQEFKLLKTIIRDYTPTDYPYQPEEGSRRAKQSDYDQVYVIPVSDPNAATMAQKVVQYQAALQLAQTAPQLYDLPQLHRQMLDVLGIKNYQKLVPISEDMKPRDPVTENMNLISGKPVKAFIGQDHQAHITVHMAAAQDPHIMKLVSQNPQMAQTIQASLSAHVAEHLGMEYRKQMEQQMGTTLPPVPKDQDDEESNMSPEMEIRVSQMAAQAAQQLLQQHQQQDQQQQNQQQSQDPLIQLQQQELQIKMQELQRKSAKDQADAALKQEQLNVERERIRSQAQTAGAAAAVKLAADRETQQRQHTVEGHKAGIEMVKHQQSLAHQLSMAERQKQTAKEQTKKGK
jgi:hypothetical protein